MIITIDNYKNINNVNLLDEVYFLQDRTDMVYVVRDYWLGRYNKGPEMEIFNILIDRGLLNESVLKFCSDAYGYNAIHYNPVLWPECKLGDHEALKRIIVAIFNLLEQEEKSIKIPLIEQNVSFLW